MLSRESPLIISLAFAGLVAGGPTRLHHDHTDTGMMTMNGLLGRQDDGFDSQDLSFIKKMAALGDSYSAGIGAGVRLGNIFDAFDPTSDWACSRYSSAYPRLVHGHDQLGDPAGRDFKFLSCSGAVMQDVIDKQIPETPSNQQVIMMSAGGNDAELVNILNHCIYQWASLQPSQGVLAKILAFLEEPFFEDLDVDVLTRTCEQQLDHSDSVVQGADFSRRLDTLINAAKKKLAPGGMIYYTGYAKFFQMGLNCDSVTWSTYLTKTHNMHHEEQYLTLAHRGRMNSLVDAVNDKLRQAVERAGSSVQFVDYSEYVDKFGGGFCGPEDDEKSTNTAERPQLMFFNLHTLDPMGTNPWKRSTDSEQKDTFAGQEDVFTYLTSKLDPEAIQRGEGDKALSLSSVTKRADMEVPKLLPDGYGRVFHPRPNLHDLIAQYVVWHMSNQNRATQGIKVVAEVGTSETCPLKQPDMPVPGGGGGSSSGQQIAIASYINPLGDPAAWSRLLTYDTGKISVLVANVLNGPDYAVELSWKSVIDQAAGQGKKIIGYVRTGYLGVSQQKFTTRLGSSDLADWASQIEQDVDKWYELYGDSLGGIFFDEGWPECGPDNIYADLYAYINNYTKRKHPGAFTVLNPGSPIAHCYEDTMDALLTFENSYETYQSSYVPNDWTPKDNRKIWHIVYRVPQDQIETVAALARSRHVGLLEITDDDNPNPYDNLPNDAYMKAVMAAVPGGKPLIEDPSPVKGDIVGGGLPSNVGVVSTDYTSVTLSWSASPWDLTTGYAVFRDGQQILELPKTLTRATIGMLDPGTSGMKFEVRARMVNVGGGSPAPVSASTKSLPATGTISKLSRSRSGDTLTFQADVLVPYAFVRLFIKSGGDDPITTDDAGWPILIPADMQADHKDRVAVYSHLVEGNDFYSSLYKYTGSWKRTSSGNADWSWTPDTVAKQTQSGYTYTWTVQLPGSASKAEGWLVQGQGYAPIANVIP